MISKYVCSGSFKRSCNYVLNKKEAEVLSAVGVRSHEANLMAIDFECQRLLHASKNAACFHGILSFPPSENPDNALMRQIAEEYLQSLGMVNTQYVFVRHHDKSHAHLHILANLVNNEGNVITDKWIGLRGKKVAQALTLKYGLTPAGEMKNVRNNQNLLNKMDQAREEIRNIITTEILQCQELKMLENALLRYNIQMQWKYKRGTSLIEGVSFKKGDYSFKGSSIDRRFSYNGLQKIFQAMELQQRLNSSSQKMDLSKNGFSSDSRAQSEENQEANFENDFKSSSHHDIGENNSTKILENALTSLAEIWTLVLSMPQDEGSYFGHITEDKKKKKRDRNNAMRM